MLEAVPLGIVVVDVIGCDKRSTQVQSQPHRGPCELGVTLQVVTLHLHVDRVRPEQLHIVFQQRPGLPTLTFQQQLRHGPIPAPR